MSWLDNEAPKKNFGVASSDSECFEYFYFTQFLNFPVFSTEAFRKNEFTEVLVFSREMSSFWTWINSFWFSNVSQNSIKMFFLQQSILFWTFRKKKKLPTESLGPNFFKPKLRVCQIIRRREVLEFYPFYLLELKQNYTGLRFSQLTSMFASVWLLKSQTCKCIWLVFVVYF
jgi:hypothetical protein